jgi:rfaE bifunctional protein nucleotidyltransferase chain/domain
MLHFGHLGLLARARALGDRLIVGLNTDESVRSLKGPSRPIIPWNERYECLKAVRWVDDVIPIVDWTPCKLIEQLKPEIVVKGPGYVRDRMPEAGIVESYGGRVVILEGPEISTTRLIERLRGLSPV